jgi:hypothetical protein
VPEAVLEGASCWGVEATRPGDVVAAWARAATTSRPLPSERVPECCAGAESRVVRARPTLRGRRLLLGAPDPRRPRRVGPRRDGAQPHTVPGWPLVALGSRSGNARSTAAYLSGNCAMHRVPARRTQRRKGKDCSPVGPARAALPVPLARRWRGRQVAAPVVGRRAPPSPLSRARMTMLRKGHVDVRRGFVRQARRVPGPTIGSALIRRRRPAAAARPRLDRARWSRVPLAARMGLPPGHGRRPRSSSPPSRLVAHRRRASGAGRVVRQRARARHVPGPRSCV